MFGGACGVNLVLKTKGMPSTMLMSDDLTKPGQFTNSVPLMVADRSKVTRCVPLTSTSVPPSVLTRAVALLIITMPSSTGVTALRWLG